MRVTGALRSLVCRPHIHQVDCCVCRAALAAPPSVSPAAKCVKSDHRVRTRGSDVVRAPHLEDANDVPTLQRRERAFATWLRECRSASFDLGARDGDVRAVEQFLDSSTVFSNERLTAAVDCLDSFCRRTSTPLDTPCSLSSASERRVEVPSVICFQVPQRARHVLEETAAVCGPPVRFEDAVSHLPPVQRVKQRTFQTALMDWKRTLDSRTRLRFFLACGTALAAHRDGCFINHDDDIDVGVFVEDLAALGHRHDTSHTERTACSAPSREAIQRGVVRLLSDLCAHSPLFVPFDICGELHRGLEIRFLHRETQVKLDLNVYYPPIAPDDDGLVAETGEFVWHSSFYEKASQRRFGMYRFRQTPFNGRLLRVSFCDTTLAPHAGGPAGFLVPPPVYLDEYFGADWRMPRAFTYAEGLAHEYKNIIAE